MLFLALGNPSFLPSYQNITSALVERNIPFKLFVHKKLTQSLNLPDKCYIPLTYKLTPWIKDYSPPIYLPSFNPLYPRGFVFAFKYQPYYASRVGKSIGSFVSQFISSCLVKNNIPTIFLPGRLDGGAITTVIRDNKVFFIIADGWDWASKCYWLSPFASQLGLSFDYFVVPVEDRFRHVDGILNVFPSLTQPNLYCFVVLNRKSLCFDLDELLSHFSSFFQVDVNCFELPYYQSDSSLDYRHPTSVINGVVLPEHKLYAFLSYKPEEDLLNHLVDIGFYSFLHSHGYEPLPILGDSILREGGGLSCASYNAWFLTLNSFCRELEERRER